MSHGVARLKELLFDSESQELVELARRLDTARRSEHEARAALAEQLRGLIDAEAAKRLELAARLDQVFERAGTEERLRAGVAKVLDGAMRKAEVERHEQLSDAIAPLIVRTIKTEIRNSQDELVDALYPMTGRMVKAYVASAMRDLIEQVNRRLELNPLMLRLKSLTTGRPVAEIVLAATQRLEIEEAYLIRRGSGALVARAPDSGLGANRDQMMSGVLTAINEFAAEAFKSDGTALRRIDLGTSQVYLRASPAYLLAVKCTGTAPASVEQEIDAAFVDAIERHHELARAPADEAAAAAEHGRLLADLSDRLGDAITSRQRALASPPLGLKPVRVLTWAVGLPLAVWLAWGLYENYARTRVASLAGYVLDTSAELQGYPTRLDISRLGQTVTLSGLAPSPSARDAVVTRLRQALPRSEVRDQVAVVPGGLREVAPELARLGRGLEALRADVARQSAARAVQRARLRLGEIVPDLEALRARLDGPARRASLAAWAGKLDVLAGELASHGAALGAAAPAADADEGNSTRALLALGERLRQAIGELAALSGHAPRPSGTTPAADASLLEAAEETAVQAERLGAVILALAQAEAVRTPPPEVSPRTRLAELVRDRAIFFASGTDYRDEAAAEETIAMLAERILAAGARIRVIGYTDEKGGPTRNSPLSLARAQKVAEALIARGVPQTHINILGRNDTLGISTFTGDMSPNRRVEIEIAFLNEPDQ